MLKMQYVKISSLLMSYAKQIGASISQDNS